ncbi:hypothetical protein [Carboxylicivirga marina]|uniref:Uncharacterized protein n=1 Tax=Carboxylicivirga marina TaxID=2800988 RepID=A0ABS1HJK4_9BACT|nr:hypothetical protein [Carboxylicivirga marina]MBK3517854.1 hypothetical protein [Carboxylicivirga marina]
MRKSLPITLLVIVLFGCTLDVSPPCGNGGYNKLDASLSKHFPVYKADQIVSFKNQFDEEMSYEVEEYTFSEKVEDGYSGCEPRGFHDRLSIKLSQLKGNYRVTYLFYGTDNGVYGEFNMRHHSPNATIRVIPKLLSETGVLVIDDLEFDDVLVFEIGYDYVIQPESIEGFKGIKKIYYSLQNGLIGYDDENSHTWRICIN